jgi:predicted DNA-binding transcriptional regulator YafY
MLQSSARLLRLLALFQSRPTWTGADLTSRLEVTGRTLRRDVDRLRSLGYPVHSTSGPAGGYMLGAGASLPPLMLDNEEGLAVAIALAGGTTNVTGVAEAGQRALAKIDQVLPARLRKRLAGLRAAIVRLPDAGPRVELGLVDTLAAACAEHRTVAMGYRDHHGAATRRAVEPQRLVLVGRRWYLVAWDPMRRDWRTFRVDRIAPPVALGAAFQPRAAPDDDVAAFVTHAVSTAPYRAKARIVFHVPAAEARERIAPSFGALEPRGARSCRLVTGGPSLDGLAVWLGICGLPFEVEDPPELVAKLREVAARLERGAGALRRNGSARRSRTVTKVSRSSSRRQ